MKNKNLILVLVVLMLFTGIASANFGGTENSDEIDEAPPEISSPPDITTSVGSEEYISWTIIEINPTIYTIFRNNGIIHETLEKGSYYNGETITIKVDTSTGSVWEYSLWAEDIIGPIADNVIVVINDDSDTTPPVIIGPPDITIEVDSPGYVAWKILEQIPFEYTLFINGDEIFTRSYMNGETINLAFDTSTAGVWYYEIFVYDRNGNWAWDDVTITVIEKGDNTPPVFTNPPDVTLFTGSEYNIEWTITEPNPDRYYISTNNGEGITPRSYYNGETVSIQVDTTTAGKWWYTICAIDSSENLAWDEVIVTVIEKVSIDIKPGSCLNLVRANSKGALPVAIIGREDFDVTQVDMSTITISANGGSVEPMPRHFYRDVTTPFEYDRHGIVPDGIMDLTINFEMEKVIAILGGQTGNVQFTVSGALYDGTLFEGTDSIQILQIKNKSNN